VAKWRQNPSNLEAEWKYAILCISIATYANRRISQNKSDELRIIEANNLGALYRHVNKRIKHRDSVPALTDSSGVTVTSDERKANIHNEYFTLVGTLDNGSQITQQEAPLTLRGQRGRCRNIKGEPQIFGSIPSPRLRPLSLWV